MHVRESWTIKKAENQRKNRCFRIVVLEKTLETWTARRLDQSILKEINLEYSLKGLMLKLKLQYFGQPIRRADSLEKTLMLRKIEGRRRREWQRMRWLDSIIGSMDMRLSKLQEMAKDREAWRAEAYRGAKSQTWLSDWTTTKILHALLINPFPSHSWQPVIFYIVSIVLPFPKGHVVNFIQYIVFSGHLLTWWWWFSFSVMSDSLRPHGLQHARFPCPSPSPGACSNSCRLSQWCHPTISPSVILFPCLQSFPAIFP